MLHLVDAALMLYFSSLLSLLVAASREVFGFEVRHPSNDRLYYFIMMFLTDN